MNTKNFILVFGIVLLILSMQNIFALGITPGRTTINFESGVTKTISFSVLNSENKDMSVVFMIRGDLASYVNLSNSYAEFSSSESSKSFTYTVNFPQVASSPGKHEVEIVALEAPKDFKEAGTFMGATVAVVSQLHIYAPYPNKYLEAELNVVEQTAGKTTFLVPVTSRGKVDIVSAKATIDLYNGAGEKVVTLETNEESLNSLERKELYVAWDTSVNPGRYNAVVTVRYDNEIATVLKEFNIGEMFLEINEVTIKDFSLGGIAKFNAFVENKWSSNLKEIYLNILVYNAQGEIMADFKSPTYDINALEQSELVAYWDTAGVKAGTYDGKLILRYGEKSTEKNIQMKITEDSIEVSGLTGHVVVSGSSGFSTTNLLLILVIFLIVVNIVWFVIVKRLLNKNRR
jgi:hypothetical protein